MFRIGARVPVIAARQLISVRYITRLSLFRPQLAPVARRVPLAVNQLRKYSVIEDEPNAKIIDYSQVKKISEEIESGKAQDTVIIDVREPEEYAMGHIPGSINIPYKTSPGALDLPEEDFEDTFGFPKPSKDQSLVFYCLAGVRSTAAEELAGTFGYDKRLNYTGSWEDWVNHKSE